MSDQPNPSHIELHTQWVGDPAAVPAPVNQFIVQAGPNVDGEPTSDTYFLTLGHLTPPFVPQTLTADQAIQFSEQNIALVVPVGKFTFTAARLRELHKVIGSVLAFAEGENDV